MKKIISLLLVFSLVFGAFLMHTSAEEIFEEIGISEISPESESEETPSVYPESEHDYQNNLLNYSEYNHPEEVEGLFVTFSPETYTEPSTYDEDSYKRGDYIRIYSLEYDTYIGRYYGDELSSKTIYIPGSAFEITLNTDESVTAYGYKIEKIETEPPEGSKVICYNFDKEKFGLSKFYSVYNNETETEIGIDLPDFLFTPFPDGCSYRYGWSTTPDGALEYEDYETIAVPGSMLNLYGTYTDLSIAADEVYRFTNSGNYFDVVEDNENINYYMTLDTYLVMLGNVMKSGGLGPMPIVILAAFLATFPNWEWGGSCYGMSSSVFLQHHGAIDMLTLQKDAETMNQLDPDSSVINAINYYQAQSATSFLCENLAPVAGTENYRAQIKKMYDSVCEGNPVLFSFYRNKYLVETGHAVVITGTYTNKNGEHVLLVYDPNDYNYAEDTISKFVISPDFSSITDYGTEITFNWTDDYTHFEAFKINGEVEPLLWYKTFFTQIFETVSMLMG